DRLELLGERDLAGERRGRRNLDDLAPLARAGLLLTFETDTDDLQGVAVPAGRDRREPIAAGGERGAQGLAVEPRLDAHDGLVVGLLLGEELLEVGIRERLRGADGVAKYRGDDVGRRRDRDRLD